MSNVCENTDCMYHSPAFVAAAGGSVVVKTCSVAMVGSSGDMIVTCCGSSAINADEMGTWVAATADSG